MFRLVSVNYHHTHCNIYILVGHIKENIGNCKKNFSKNSKFEKLKIRREHKQKCRNSLVLRESRLSRQTMKQFFQKCFDCFNCTFVRRSVKCCRHFTFCHIRCCQLLYLIKTTNISDE